MVAIGLLALLAMVGLALDSGHAVLNKSRLQNTVDASALAAAKVLDSTGSEANADTAARSVFDLNAASQPELNRVMSGADLTIQFSTTLDPWAPGSTPANYVRVVAQDFTMWTSFTSLVGITETRMAASAVAGPSAPVGMTEGNEACDLAPMMICADMSPGAPGNFGYTGDNVTLLKMRDRTSPAPSAPATSSSSNSAARARTSCARTSPGSYNQCIDPSGTVETKPGNDTGPTAQGLNTRFGEYQGGGMNATDFPPDKVTTEPSPAARHRRRSAVRHLARQRQCPGHGHQPGQTTAYKDYAEDLESGPFNFPSGKPSAAYSRCHSWTARARSTDRQRSRSSGSDAST